MWENDTNGAGLSKFRDAEFLPKNPASAGGWKVKWYTLLSLSKCGSFSCFKHTVTEWKIDESTSASSDLNISS